MGSKAEAKESANGTELTGCAEVGPLVAPDSPTRGRVEAWVVAGDNSSSGGAPTKPGSGGAQGRRQHEPRCGSANQRRGREVGSLGSPLGRGRGATCRTMGGRVPPIPRGGGRTCQRASLNRGKAVAWPQWDLDGQGRGRDRRRQRGANFIQKQGRAQALISRDPRQGCGSIWVWAQDTLPSTVRRRPAAGGTGATAGATRRPARGMARREIMPAEPRARDGWRATVVVTGVHSRWGRRRWQTVVMRLRDVGRDRETDEGAREARDVVRVGVWLNAITRRQEELERTGNAIGVRRPSGKAKNRHVAPGARLGGDVTPG